MFKQWYSGIWAMTVQQEFRLQEIRQQVKTNSMGNT